jgi:hypothetical protein
VVVLLVVREKYSLNVFTSLPHVLYFGRCACYLRDIWLLINTKAEEMKGDDNLIHKAKYHEVNKLLEDARLLLIYFNEIMNFCPELADVSND